MSVGLLYREVSISSTLACEEVSSGGAETSAFGGRSLSAPAAASSPWQSVWDCHCSHLPCLSQLSH